MAAPPIEESAETGETVERRWSNRMRRRRRNRGTWFPVLGTEISESETGTATFLTYTQNTSTVVGSGGFSGPDPTALVNDETLNNQAAGVSLRDAVEGNAWLCQRVVGSIFCRVHNPSQGSFAGDFLCAAALAVLPTDDESGAIALDSEEYSPFRAENSANPWLWRRVWALTDPGIAAIPQGAYPSSNAHYGDMRSGPFLDTKGSKRIIQREQRLFIITEIVPLEMDESFPGEIEWTYDLRVFGAMVKQRNRSTFK